MKPSGSSSVAVGSMLMCKLFCSADFVMGPYYTGQGTCKSATRGEEQVSSNRPSKVFPPSCILAGYYIATACWLLSFSWQLYAIPHIREAVCAGRKFSLFSTGMLCPMLAPWSKIGWHSRSSSCLMPIPLERKAYWPGKNPLTNILLICHQQLVAKRMEIWFILSADCCDRSSVEEQFGNYDDHYFLFTHARLSTNAHT